MKGDRVLFDFPAKSARRQVQEIADPSVLPTIRTLKKRKGGGQELFAYRSGNGWSDVKTADINEYLKELTGDEFTAKDFRTWNATVLAAVAVATEAEGEISKTARKQVVNRAVEEVAEYLNNSRPSAARPTSTRGCSIVSTQAKRSGRA